MSDAKYLIVKQGFYYRPNSGGYTGLKDEAGRYSLDDVAVRFPNTESPRQDGMSYMLEDDAPEYSSQCCPVVRARHHERKTNAEIDQLRREVAILHHQLAKANTCPHCKPETNRKE